MRVPLAQNAAVFDFLVLADHEGGAVGNRVLFQLPFLRVENDDFPVPREDDVLPLAVDDAADASEADAAGAPFVSGSTATSAVSRTTATATDPSRATSMSVTGAGSGGTAAGTAADSSEMLPGGEYPPDKFLKAGDTVEIRSPIIGSLRAKIVPKPVAK